MESPIPSPNIEDDDVFLDAFDAFDEPPFSLTAESESSISSVTLSSPSGAASSTTTLRRRSLSRHTISGDDSKDSNLDTDFTISPDSFSAEDTKPGYQICGNRKEKEEPELERTLGPVSSTAQDQELKSTITTETVNRVLVDDDSVESAAEQGASSFNWLIFIAGLVIKAISFQINLFVTFTTFPFFFLYHFYIFITNPFQTLRRSTGFVVQKLSQSGDTLRQSLSQLLIDRLGEHKWVWKVALRCGWGLLWSLYICVILCGLLVSSLVVSGIFMRYLVEEPIQMKETLVFDYTKHSPVAYVPVPSCAGVGCGEDCGEEIGALRVIPPKHRLQATVALKLPESEYNKNLGIFQVRVDLLSASGKTLASSRRPSMLQFMSEPIRLVMTFLKIAPLLTGCVAEAQTLNLKFRGFTEGDVPTSCLRVTIEQRAEYRPGAGIPEVYDAALILETELSLFKKVIWYWKKTIFIWMSMMSFMMQLVFTLVCCRPIVIPKARTRDGSARTIGNQVGPPAQG